MVSDKKGWKPIFVLAVALIVTLFMTYLMVKIQDDIWRQFVKEAKEYLGTDNFKVECHDGLFVAITEDGRQYPPEEWIESYWWNRIIYTGISGGVIIVLSFILLLSVDWYVKREEKRGDN